jgi:putative ubiquitin-RnfH superfamily antitoxin RatB of RatAB toxin-antitoxin module
MIKTSKVEVPYATAADQLILIVEFPEEVTAREAVELSGIGDHFADIEMDQTAIGIFSKPLNGKMLSMPGDCTRARRSGGNIPPSAD